MTPREKSRNGHTLLEMVIAISIFALVAAQLAGVTIGAFRLLRGNFTESELALVTRQFRERLLFKARPDVPPKRSAGLLSAPARDRSNRLISSSEPAHDLGWSSIAAVIPFVDEVTGLDGHYPASAFAIGSTWNARRNANDLMIWDQNNAAAQRWLLPFGVCFGWDWGKWNDESQTGAAFADKKSFDNSSKRYYNLTIRYVIDGVERRERVLVPVFGMVQQ